MRPDAFGIRRDTAANRNQHVRGTWGCRACQTPDRDCGGVRASNQVIVGRQRHRDQIQRA